MPDYIVRIDYRFEAVDDPAARSKAKAIVAAIVRPFYGSGDPIEPSIKLQRSVLSGRPRGVKL